MCYTVPASRPARFSSRSFRPLHLADGRQRQVGGRRRHVVLPAEAGVLGVVFDVLGEDAGIIGHQELVVVLAHDDLLAEQVLVMHVLQRQRDLQRIGRPGLVDRIGQHVDHGDEIERREIGVVAAGPPVIGEFLRLRHLEIDRQRCR